MERRRRARVRSRRGSAPQVEHWTRSVRSYESRIRELYPVVKSKRTGCESSFALGPTVGWKNSRTGAVCSIIYRISAKHQDNRSQRSIPTGMCSFHRQSPVFRIPVGFCPRDRPWPSSCPADPTQAEIVGRARIQSASPEQ